MKMSQSCILVGLLVITICCDCLASRGDNKEDVGTCIKTILDKDKELLKSLSEYFMRKNTMYHMMMEEFKTKTKALNLIVKESKNETEHLQTIIKNDIYPAILKIQETKQDTKADYQRVVGAFQKSMTKVEEFKEGTISNFTKVMVAIEKTVSLLEEMKKVKAAVWTEVPDASWEAAKLDIQRQCKSPETIVRTVEQVIQSSKLDSNIKRIDGNNRRIKRSLYIVDSDILPSRAACLRYCFTDRKSEVCQISYSVSFPDGMKCRAYPLRAGCVKAFSDRYMEDANNPNRIYEVYFDGTKDDLPETKPILFYALDSLSQGANLGSLETKFSLDMGTTTPRFDCDVNFSRQKFLRLVPDDRFVIQIPNASSLPTPRHFTFIVWMKKNNPNQGAAPIIEGTSASHTVGDWSLWNYDVPNKIRPYFGRQAVTSSSTLNVHDWNIVALRVNDGQMDLFVNGKLVQSVAVTSNVRSFGDRVYIGRRIGNPSGWGQTDYMFDGCLANMMIFTNALSDADISRYSKLVSDPNF